MKTKTFDIIAIASIIPFIVTSLLVSGDNFVANYAFIITAYLAVILILAYVKLEHVSDFVE